MKRLLRPPILFAACVIAALLAVVLSRVEGSTRPTEISRLQGLKVSYRVTPDIWARLAPVVQDYGVTSAGRLFLQTAKGLVEIDHDGDTPALASADTTITSLAIGADDHAMTVAKGFLGVLQADGRPVLAGPSPYSGARVMPSSVAGAVFLISRSQRGWDVHRFQENGLTQWTAALDEEPVAVADTRSDLFVATPAHVLRISKSGPSVVFAAPRDPAFGSIVSAAVSADGTLYVATATRVFQVLAQGRAISIVNDSGGALRWRDGVLWVLDPNRKLVYALSPTGRTLLEGP